MAEPEDFEALPGIGVRARVGSHSIVVGRPELFDGHRDGALGSAVANRATGASIVVVGFGDRAAGLLLLEDTLRPEAEPTLARLTDMGLHTVLITGDRRSAAEPVAERLAIPDVHAEVLPQDKARVVEALQAQGRRVAFVGDGVNDGPALATADVGVAMGLSGTDLALETAQIALLSDDLTKLPHLLDLSQRAMRAIRQNVAFSLAVLGFAVAATIAGLLHPVSGALLHELSSIPVIANSARLIGLRADTEPAPAPVLPRQVATTPLQ